MVVAATVTASVRVLREKSDADDGEGLVVGVNIYISFIGIRTLCDSVARGYGDHSPFTTAAMVGVNGLVTDHVRRGSPVFCALVGNALIPARPSLPPFALRNSPSLLPSPAHDPIGDD